MTELVRIILCWRSDLPPVDRPIFPAGELKRPPHDRLPIPESLLTFPWEIGVRARSRGAVQNDRWRGRMARLIGLTDDKLIAIVPALGLWEQRKTLKFPVMSFSRVVSVFGPGVYAAVAAERPGNAVAGEATPSPLPSRQFASSGRCD